MNSLYLATLLANALILSIDNLTMKYEFSYT